MEAEKSEPIFLPSCFCLNNPFPMNNSKFPILNSRFPLFLSLLFVRALATSMQAAETPSSGLVAHWKFDEESGVQVTDSSNGKHDGKLLRAVRAAGKFGGAIECRQDALVGVPHAATLDDFKNGLTVSAWVKRDADATWNMILSREIKDGPS